MSLKRFLLVRLGRLLTYPVRRQLRQFEVACQHPEAVQTALLLDILRKQTDTQFGRDHSFAAVRTVADYRTNVPVAPYEYVAPYIEKVQNGDTRALLADRRVLMFALTSGTTASRKLIPVTDAYLAAYRRGWNMWGVKMYRDNRGRRIAMRPIVQLGGDPEEFRTPAGIPCGNLSGYTAMVQRRLIRRMYAVPYVTGKIKDAKARYYVALRFSIGRNVSQLMAANPSTLVQLARTLDAEKDSSSPRPPRRHPEGRPRHPAGDSRLPRPAGEAGRGPRERTHRGRVEARPTVPDGRVAVGGDRHQLLDRRQHGAVPAAAPAILR